MLQTPTSPTKPKLLIVDDDELLQDYFSSFFSGKGYECEQLLTGEDITSYFDHKEKKPQLVLLDVLLPGENGFHWLQWLNKKHPKLPIIMLTGETKDDDRVQGLSLGAVDYINKPFNSEELLLRVQTMLRLHDSGKDENILSFGSYRFDFDTQVLKYKGIEVHLTTNEKSLLAILCKNYQEVVSREDLNTAIGVTDYHPLDRRIDVHISRLRTKLDSNGNKAKYIHVVRNSGYFLRYIA